MGKAMHKCSGVIKKATLTKRQKEYVDAYKEAKSTTKAARILGVTDQQAARTLRSITKKLGLNTVRDFLRTDISVEVKKDNSDAVGLMDLLRKQEFRCALSGKELTPKNAELDHIVPRSKGGSDDLDNLQWLDKRINRMKGQMSQEQFLDCCRKVALWNR